MDKNHNKGRDKEANGIDDLEWPECALGDDHDGLYAWVIHLLLFERQTVGRLNRIFAGCRISSKQILRVGGSCSGRFSSEARFRVYIMN